MVEPEYLMILNRISDSLLRVAHAAEAMAKSVDPGFVTHDATMKIRAMRQRPHPPENPKGPTDQHSSSSIGR
jgi:hypothetical protein